MEFRTILMRHVILLFVHYMFKYYLCQFYIVACRAVCRQRLGKHVPTATDTHGTIEVLLETVFSTRSVQRDYKADN
jgi:hypothetical protein